MELKFGYNNAYPLSTDFSYKEMYSGLWTTVFTFINSGIYGSTNFETGVFLTKRIEKEASSNTYKLGLKTDYINLAEDADQGRFALPASSFIREADIFNDDSKCTVESISDMAIQYMNFLARQITKKASGSTAAKIAYTRRKHDAIDKTPLWIGRMANKDYNISTPLYAYIATKVGTIDEELTSENISHSNLSYYNSMHENEHSIIAPLKKIDFEYGEILPTQNYKRLEVDEGEEILSSHNIDLNQECFFFNTSLRNPNLFYTHNQLNLGHKINLKYNEDINSVRKDVDFLKHFLDVDSLFKKKHNLQNRNGTKIFRNNNVNTSIQDMSSIYRPALDAMTESIVEVYKVLYNKTEINESYILSNILNEIDSLDEISLYKTNNTIFDKENNYLNLAKRLFTYKEDIQEYLFKDINKSYVNIPFKSLKMRINDSFYKENISYTMDIRKSESNRVVPAESQIRELTKNNNQFESGLLPKHVISDFYSKTISRSNMYGYSQNEYFVNTMRIILDISKEVQTSLHAKNLYYGEVKNDIINLAKICKNVFQMNLKFHNKMIKDYKPYMENYARIRLSRLKQSLYIDPEESLSIYFNKAYKAYPAAYFDYILGYTSKRNLYSDFYNRLMWRKDIDSLVTGSVMSANPTPRAFITYMTKINKAPVKDIKIDNAYNFFNSRIQDMRTKDSEYLIDLTSKNSIIWNIYKSVSKFNFNGRINFSELFLKTHRKAFMLKENDLTASKIYGTTTVEFLNTDVSKIERIIKKQISLNSFMSRHGQSFRINNDNELNNWISKRENTVKVIQAYIKYITKRNTNVKKDDIMELVIPNKKPVFSIITETDSVAKAKSVFTNNSVSKMIWAQFGTRTVVLDKSTVLADIKKIPTSYNEIIKDTANIFISKTYQEHGIYLDENVKANRIHSDVTVNNKNENIYFSFDRVIEEYNKQILATMDDNEVKIIKDLFSTEVLPKLATSDEYTVFICDKERLKTIIGVAELLENDKTAYSTVFNPQLTVDLDTPYDDFFDSYAFGRDELIIPQKDFNYMQFKKNMVDINGRPINPVRLIDNQNFIAKYPTSHPLPLLGDVGREYIELEGSLVKMMIEVLYRMWQQNIFKFGAMDMRASTERLLQYMDLFVETRLPEQLYKQGKRIIQMFRWYGESAILNNAEFRIYIDFSDYTIPLHNNIIGLESSMTNMAINQQKFILETIDDNNNSSFEIYVENPVEANFAAHVVVLNGKCKIYLNDEIINVLKVSQKVIIPLEQPKFGSKNIIRFDMISDGCSKLILAGLKITNYIYNEIKTEYEPKAGTGNIAIDFIIKKAKALTFTLTADELQDELQELRNGNLAVSELVDRLVEYFNLHHAYKDKGKRLTTKQ